MKLLLPILFALLPVPASADEPTFNLADWAGEETRSTSVTTFPVSTTRTRNQHYQLSVALPESYHTNPEKRYPVLYLLDPYWDFDPINSIIGTLRYDKYIPEIIVVGIGYAGENPDYGTFRQIDYTPVADSYDKNSGDAPVFLQFLEKEVIPKIESELRADPSHRALVGASLGGLFALYAMLEKPDLFQGYLASSPAILWGRRWIMQREIDFYWSDSQALWLEKTQSELPTKLFMTVGSDETEVNWINEIKAFDALIANREYRGFEYEFHVLDGYHHGGVKFPTFTRGLPFLFEGYAP